MSVQLQRQATLATSRGEWTADPRDDLVAQLARERVVGGALVGLRELADRHAIAVFGLLFPHYAARCAERRVEVAAELDALDGLLAQALAASGAESGFAGDAVIGRVHGRLGAIREAVLEDARAMYDGDPAARSVDEVILAYPGFLAIGTYRIAHELRGHLPLFARLLTEVAHRATGIDIHPGARIGASFAIDHGTGIVIGETAELGERVRLHQGVTLGAAPMTKSLRTASASPRSATTSSSTPTRRSWAARPSSAGAVGSAATFGSRAACRPTRSSPRRRVWSDGRRSQARAIPSNSTSDRAAPASPAALTATTPMMRFNDILETIGDTPHIRINRLFDTRVEMWMKAERANPGGSIKDRIALEMVEDAERRVAVYGADLELTPRELGVKGAIARAADTWERFFSVEGLADVDGAAVRAAARSPRHPCPDSPATCD